MRQVRSARMTTGNSSPFALCTVISRTPSLPSSTNRRFGRVGRVGRLAQLVDEAAERNAAAGLVLARQLGDVQDVGQHLLAGRPQHEADVRARQREQPADRVGDRDDRCGRGAAAAAARSASAIGSRCDVGSPVSANFSPELPPSSSGTRNGWKAPKRWRNSSSVLVVDREERSLQRREHRQLVVGPFDGGERRANRLDLLAVVERAAADEQVRQPARLDRVDVAGGSRRRRS